MSKQGSPSREDGIKQPNYLPFLGSPMKTTANSGMQEQTTENHTAAEGATSIYTHQLGLIKLNLSGNMLFERLFSYHRRDHVSLKDLGAAFSLYSKGS